MFTLLIFDNISIDYEIFSPMPKYFFSFSCHFSGAFSISTFFDYFITLIISFSMCRNIIFFILSILLRHAFQPFLWFLSPLRLFLYFDISAQCRAIFDIIFFTWIFFSSHFVLRLRFFSIFHFDSFSSLLSLLHFSHFHFFFAFYFGAADIDIFWCWYFRLFRLFFFNIDYCSSPAIFIIDFDFPSSSFFRFFFIRFRFLLFCWCDWFFIFLMLSASFLFHLFLRWFQLLFFSSFFDFSFQLITGLLFISLRLFRNFFFRVDVFFISFSIIDYFFLLFIFFDYRAFRIISLFSFISRFTFSAIFFIIFIFRYVIASPLMLSFLEAPL